MTRLRDLTGQRFGGLTVVASPAVPDGSAGATADKVNYA